MENILIAAIDSNVGFGIFIFSAILCSLFSFLIICYARALGNKLLLLGVLVTLTAIVFAATMPPVAKLAYVMLATAVILVITGVVVSVVSHFSGLSKSDSKPPEQA